VKAGVLVGELSTRLGRILEVWSGGYLINLNSFASSGRVEVEKESRC
jgi:hypothetical protein